MQVLKIKLYQLFANYRKPLSYRFIDTFPLPTYSNIRGLIHRILESNEYVPLSISIQGLHESIVYDLQILNKFDRFEESRMGKGVKLPNFQKVLMKTPFYVANLYNINLIVHIFMEDRYLKTIKEKIFDNYYSLGRHEDIVRIDEISFVKVEKKYIGLEAYKLKYPIYLKKETAERHRLRGINFRIPFKYEIVNGLRYFIKEDIVYIEEGTFLGEITVDEEHDLVELVGDYYE